VAAKHENDENDQHHVVAHPKGRQDKDEQKRQNAADQHHDQIRSSGHSEQ
jgi:hypothetical protein